LSKLAKAACYFVIACRRGLAHMGLSTDNILLDKPFFTEVWLAEKAKMFVPDIL
jgi:hypothetical protein